MKKAASIILVLLILAMTVCSFADEADQLKKKWMILGMGTSSSEMNEELEPINQAYRSGLIVQTEEYFSDYYILSTGTRVQSESQENQYSYTLKKSDGRLLMYKGDEEKPYEIEFFNRDGLECMSQTVYIGQNGNESEGFIVYIFATVDSVNNARK